MFDGVFIGLEIHFIGEIHSSLAPPQDFRKHGVGIIMLWGCFSLDGIEHQVCVAYTYLLYLSVFKHSLPYQQDTHKQTKEDKTCLPAQ